VEAVVDDETVVEAVVDDEAVVEAVSGDEVVHVVDAAVNAVAVSDSIVPNIQRQMLKGSYSMDDMYNLSVSGNDKLPSLVQRKYKSAITLYKNQRKYQKNSLLKKNSSLIRRLSSSYPVLNKTSNFTMIRKTRSQPRFSFSSGYKSSSTSLLQSFANEMLSSDVFDSLSRSSDSHDLVSVTPLSSSYSLSSIFSDSSQMSIREEGSTLMMVSIISVPLGLDNTGNICYMNSVLQCLSHTYSLTTYFLTAHEQMFQHQSLRVYHKFIQRMWQDFTVTNFEPYNLRMTFRSSVFYVGSGQQDAQEYLNFFVSKLHEAMNKADSVKIIIDDTTTTRLDELAEQSWKKKLSTDNSYITDLFMGQLRSSLICVKCQHASYSFEPFRSLSLPLPPKNNENVNKSITIYDCLDMYAQEEILRGNDRPNCSSCNSKQVSVKLLNIQRFPKILVLHLKRFCFTDNECVKLDDSVEFYNELNISKSPINSNKVMYNLYGYIDHHGMYDWGHYTASCKHIGTQMWYKFNDSCVMPIGCELDSVQSKNVYILFYQREDPDD
jgi:ubiquitin carboxyl-terminal hydrolase 2/21